MRRAELKIFDCGYFRLVALCMVVSGCATYKSVNVSTAEPVVRAGDEFSSIWEGDVVRTVLHSGKKIAGRVLWLTDEKLALDRGGNYGNEVVVIDVADIDYAEVRIQSDGQLEGLWFAAIGAALVATIYLMFSKTSL